MNQPGVGGSSALLVRSHDFPRAWGLTLAQVGDFDQGSDSSTRWGAHQLRSGHAGGAGSIAARRCFLGVPGTPERKSRRFLTIADANSKPLIGTEALVLER